MKHEIKIPKMGESIVEAVISAFLKENGAFVQRDEEILEIETDKVNQVLYAPAAGMVQWNVALHDTVKIDQVVGIIDTSAAAPPPEKPSERKAVAIQPAEEQPSPPPAPEETPQETKARETRRPMSKIRQVIAQRLVEAQKETAMLSTFNEVDMSAVMELRARNQERFFKKHQVKLGLMPFFVKATVAALQQFPSLNSYIKAEEIIHREYYDIGIAVSTDRGLVVPVLRNCDKLSFAEIDKQIVAYAKQAREGGLSVDDLQGGGFTITNGGVFGSLLSTPLLSPSQSGVLGMHKIQYRPVAVNDSILIHPMMYLALSYDHRLVDGKEAISFLVTIKDLVEDPARLLLS